jgi:hypothetical protein
VGTWDDNIGTWQDYLNAHDCSECAKLVRVLASSNHVLGATGADMVQFSGDLTWDRFEIRRVGRKFDSGGK